MAKVVAAETTPDVPAIAAVATQLDVVAMGGFAVLEDVNELLRAVSTTTAPSSK
jgi:hypothetical protein